MERTTSPGVAALRRRGHGAVPCRGLSAAGVQALDAQGKPVTPALFGGINAIGVEEVSGESSTVDSHIDLPQNQFGLRPEFDITLNNRFAWGEVDLLLNVQRGYVTQAQVYSDALDEGLILRIAPLLTGCQFTSAALSERLRALGGVEGEDLAGWILNESL